MSERDPLFRFDPEKCAKCPTVRQFAMQSNATREVATAAGVESLAAESQLPAIAQQFFDSMDGEIGMVDKETGEVAASPEAIAKLMSKGFQEEISKLYAKADEEEDKARQLVASCEDGPLTMRATRAGQIVTTTVCMNPNMPPEQSCGSAVITRSPTN